MLQLFKIYAILNYRVYDYNIQDSEVIELVDATIRLFAPCKTLHSDAGGTFIANEFRNFLIRSLIILV